MKQIRVRQYFRGGRRVEEHLRKPHSVRYLKVHPLWEKGPEEKRKEFEKLLHVILKGGEYGAVCNFR